MSVTDKKQIKKKALGKGIEALLGSSGALGNLNQGTTNESNRTRIPVIQVAPQDIDPNPQQPRKFFVESEISELAASVRSNGIIQPLIVTKSKLPGRYTLIAGERRLRASIAAKLPSIPVIVREGTDEDILRIAILENIQRSDLNIIEEASAYRDLIDNYGLTQEQCAEKLGKERSTIANYLRVLNLPKEIQDDLIQKRLTMGHAKVLLGLESKQHIQTARQLILKNDLNVRQTEKLCKSLKNSEAGSKPLQSNRDADLNYLVESLRERLRTKVKFVGNGTRGKIEISYFSASELERLLEIMGLESL